MADITDKLIYTGENILTVAVNNTLDPETIPQGKVKFKDDTDRLFPFIFNVWNDHAYEQ